MREGSFKGKHGLFNFHGIADFRVTNVPVLKRRRVAAGYMVREPGLKDQDSWSRYHDL